MSAPVPPPSVPTPPPGFAVSVPHAAGTPELAPYPGMWPRAPLGPVPRPIRGIGRATRWLLVVYGALALVAAAISTWDIVTFDTYRPFSTSNVYIDTDAFNAFVLSETASTIVSVGSGAVYVATAVCWVVWQYRAASSLPPVTLRRTPGWHVGSWFVPVVSLWFPFQNITDLTRASHARVSDGVRRAWWTLWIASGMTSRVGYALSVGFGHTAGGMVADLVGQVVTDLLAIAAAVFAWIIVARITDAIADPQREERVEGAHDFG